MNLVHFEVLMVLTHGFAKPWAGAPMVLENHGHTCKVQIKAQFSRNDLNGSRNPIYTTSISLQNPQFEI
uniref:Uncharacterized protein n=1 Tax=Helianthus annuus TaxID=4232 RepID=A0A251RL56_HELAN